MSLDWLTVAAQAVNFLILVWLLHRFLYAPITNAVRSREMRIQERIDEAAEIKRQAEADAERYKKEREGLEREREKLLAAAREAANEHRRGLEHTIRLEISGLRDRWRSDALGERDAFVQEVRQVASQQFFVLAREALGDLADRSLNDAVSESFSNRLLKLEPERVAKLKDAAAHSDQIIQVASSFELGSTAKRRITKVVHDVICHDAQIAYGIENDLICGIRLRAGGQTISWSIASYLTQLENRLRDEIEQKIGHLQPGAGE